MLLPLRSKLRYLTLIKEALVIVFNDVENCILITFVDCCKFIAMSRSEHPPQALFIASFPHTV